MKLNQLEEINTLVAERAKAVTLMEKIREWRNTGYTGVRIHFLDENAKTKVTIAYDSSAVAKCALGHLQSEIDGLETALGALGVEVES